MCADRRHLDHPTRCCRNARITVRALLLRSPIPLLHISFSDPTTPTAFTEEHASLYPREPGARWPLRGSLSLVASDPGAPLTIAHSRSATTSASASRSLCRACNALKSWSGSSLISGLLQHPREALLRAGSPDRLLATSHLPPPCQPSRDREA